jgi:hypothetical protein
MSSLGLLGCCYSRQGEIKTALETLGSAQQIYQTIGSGATRGNSTIFLNCLAEAYLTAAENLPLSERKLWLKETRRVCSENLRQARGCRDKLPGAMRWQGTCEWLCNKPRAAKRWWQRSLVRAEEHGYRYDLGKTHLEMGRHLNDRAHLKQAETIFADIDAEWDLQQAREAMKGLGEK